MSAGHEALVPGKHCPVAVPPVPTPTQQVFALRSQGVVPQMGTPESPPEPDPESTLADPDDPPESATPPELLELGAPELLDPVDWPELVEPEEPLEPPSCPVIPPGAASSVKAKPGSWLPQAENESEIESEIGAHPARGAIQS